jgi:hypothetical protein
MISCSIKRRGASFGVVARKFGQTFRRPKHLVCIPAHAGPPEGTDLIDNLGRVRSAVSQIAAMDHEVRCNLPQVGKNCLEGAQVAVNVRYDCDTHFAPAAENFIAWRQP